MVLLLCGALLAPWTAQARDMTGKASVGVLMTNDGLAKLALRYWRTQMAVEVTAGWESRTLSLPTVQVQNGVERVPSGATAADVERCVLAADDPTNATTCASTYSTTALRIGFALLYRIGDARQASLAVGLRPWVQLESDARSDRISAVSAAGVAQTSRTLSEVGDAPLRYGVEIPLQAEAFVTDHISVVGSVALSASLGRLTRRAGDGPGQRSQKDDLWLGLGGVFSGGAGISYYF